MGIKKLAGLFKILLLTLIFLLSACQEGDTGETGNTAPGGGEGPSKTPEELLEEQEIDDDHDAFLVDTGGRLGKLLVTVNITDQGNRNDESGVMLRFDIWDTGHMEAPLQTMERSSHAFHWSDVADANFDGFMDFGYMYAMGNQPCYWSYWLWNEEEGRFVYEPAFDDISCPVFQPETKTIRGWARSSAMGTGLYTIHQWIDGELICVRRIEMDYDSSDDIADLEVTDYIDGEFIQVYYNTYPVESGERFDDSAKWSDLEYHGGN